MKLSFWHLALFVAIMAALRLVLADVANLAPVAAIGIFAAYYLKSYWKAITIALATLLLSDVFLELTKGDMLYWGRMFDYAAIAAAVGVVALIFKKYRRPQHIAISVLAGSMLFFFMSNLGVWIGSSMYAKTLSGLAQCFEMAIPFYRGTLLGDLLFSGVFFGAFEAYSAITKQAQKV